MTLPQPRQSEVLQELVNSKAYQNLHDAIVEGQSSEQVLNRVVSTALELTSASDCALFVYTEDPISHDRYFRVTRESADLQTGRIDLEKRIRKLEKDNILVLPEPFAKRFCIPIKSSSRVLGALAVRPGLPPEEEQTLHALATFAAMAIAKAKSTEDARREANALARFLETSRLLLSVEDARRALENIAEVACSDLEADLVVLYEYSAERRAIKLPPVEVGERRSGSWLFPSENRWLPLSEAPFRIIIQDGRPFYMNDARRGWFQEKLIPEEWSLKTRKFLEEEKIISSAGVPIRVNGEVLGLMFLNYRWNRSFNPRFRLRAEAITDLASLAIRNSRVLKRQDEYKRQLEQVLTEIGRALSDAAPRGTEQILRVISDQTARVMSVENLYIAFYDQALERVEFVFAEEGKSTLELGKEEWAPRVAGQGLTEWVIHHRAPVLIQRDVGLWMKENDVKLYGRMPQSWAGAPLIVAGKVLGMIGVQSYRNPNAFDDNDCTVLASIATQASIALGNAGLGNTAPRRIELLDTLEKSALEIASTAEVRPRLQTIARLAAEMLGAKGGKIYLKHRRVKEELVLEAVHGIGANRYSLGRTLAIDQGMAGEVIRTGRPLIVDDYSKYKNRVPELTDVFSAVVAVPLKRQAGFSHPPDAENIGVLAVFDDKEDRTFSDADVPILEQFGLHASLTIRDTSRLNEMKAINRIGGDLLEKVRSKEELLEEIAQQIAVTLKCNHCTLFFVREREGRRQLVPEVTYSREDRAKVERSFDLDEGLLGLVYKKKTTLNFTDAASHPAFALPQSPSLGSYHERSILIAPIQVNSETIALVSADHEALNWFDDWDVELLDILAHQAGVTIKQSELREQEANSRKQLSCMLEISRILAGLLVSGTKGLSKAFHSIYEQVNCVIEAPTFFLALYDTDSQRLDFSNLYYQGVRLELEQPRRVRNSDRGFTEYVMKSARTLSIGSLSSERAVGNLPVEGIDLVDNPPESMIFVPLISRGVTIGVISVQHEEPSRYTARDEMILEMIADRTAIAIDNVMLYGGINRKLEETSRKIADAEKLTLAHSLKIDVIHRIPNLIGGIPDRAREVIRYLKNERGAITAESSISLLEGVYRDSAELIAFASKWNPLEDKSLGAVVQVENLIESVLFRIEMRPSIQAHFYYEDDLPGILCDPRLLYETFHHMISNAAESMSEQREGQLNVEVEKVRNGDNGEWLGIVISDTGRGISKEQRPKIFDLFYSAKSGKGFGYGLWRAKKIIESLGGSIQVDSAVGSGSTFIVRLPAADP